MATLKDQIEEAYHLVDQLNVVVEDLRQAIVGAVTILNQGENTDDR